MSDVDLFLGIGFLTLGVLLIIIGLNSEWW